MIMVMMLMICVINKQMVNVSTESCLCLDEVNLVGVVYLTVVLLAANVLHMLVSHRGHLRHTGRLKH